MGTEREHARQIDQLECRIVDPDGSNMLFDRDTGVIAGPLAQTGKAIEQGTLARVGIARDRDTGRRMPAY